MNYTPTKSTTRPHPHRAFIAGLAVGGFFALGVAVQLIASGYLNLDLQSHWPVTVLLSAAANFVRLVLHPAVPLWTSAPILFPLAAINTHRRPAQ